MNNDTTRRAQALGRAAASAEIAACLIGIVLMIAAVWGSLLVDWQWITLTGPALTFPVLLRVLSLVCDRIAAADPMTQLEIA